MNTSTTTTSTNMQAAATNAGALPHAVSYPSYKSFDQFISVNKLRALDAYLRSRVMRHIAADRDDYFVNQHVLEADAPYRPGVREIWLTRTAPGTPYDYLDIDRSDLWHWTEAAFEFTLLMEFISTLPFESTGRILLIYDEGENIVPAHRDHETTTICHDFIWLRTNLNKPFYVYDPAKNDKLYVEGYSAWFDTVNQYHGSDPADGLTFSIRVDGHFTPEFRQQIPYAQPNAASTPSVWAMQDVRA